MTQATTVTAFGRIAIAILAIEWVVFGSMHFFMIEETVAQIPIFFPAKHALAILTGILEVSTGILILFRATRKWAAALSFALLVVLLPAMAYILVSDAAFLPGTSAWSRTAFRIILVPNNLFLAICSIYLWRHPHDRPAG